MAPSYGKTISRAWALVPVLWRAKIRPRQRLRRMLRHSKPVLPEQLSLQLRLHRRVEVTGSESKRSILGYRKVGGKAAIASDVSRQLKRLLGPIVFCMRDSCVERQRSHARRRHVRT